MLVFPDGRTIGTIGGGCYENDAFWKAREALATGRSALLHYELNDDFAQENGLVCGGQMDVHIDPLEPTALFIIGAATSAGTGPARDRRRIPCPRRRRSREVCKRRALSPAPKP